MIFFCNLDCVWVSKNVDYLFFESLLAIIDNQVVYGVCEYESKNRIL